jgi:hypothetical protein
MVNSEVARISSCVYRREEIATATIGGRRDTGECHVATMVFGFLSVRSAVTRATTLGDRRRWKFSAEDPAFGGIRELLWRPEKRVWC